MIKQIFDKECTCEHCLRKLKQINQSTNYWEKIIIIEKKAA